MNKEHPDIRLSLVQMNKEHPDIPYICSSNTSIMKKLLTILIIYSAINAKADSWVQKASFPGLGLKWTFSFSIGNKGYVGCGKDSASFNHKDFWEYDPTSDTWTQKADFGG